MSPLFDMAMLWDRLSGLGHPDYRKLGELVGGPSAALTRIFHAPRVGAPAFSRLSAANENGGGRFAPLVTVKRLKPAESRRSGLSAFRAGCEISELGFEPMPFGYSVRGQCRTGRRKDRWFCNPKGIVSSSPGLPSPRGYPGIASVRFSTPTGLCPLSAIAPQPRWLTPPAFPRVARGSQPWASGRNPFGIHHWNFRKALAQILPADKNVCHMR